MKHYAKAGVVQEYWVSSTIGKIHIKVYQYITSGVHCKSVRQTHASTLRDIVLDNWVGFKYMEGCHLKSQIGRDAVNVFKCRHAIRLHVARIMQRFTSSKDQTIFR